ncbi:hypothetical protein K443DRAFT_12987 [Laccaria amethystina LaAM-08-1]|uniref:Uncharacterized protein n=1 Tax=Laccaria amethystina LaAM-08-1 TaxID=1095629 RepID=A0A0C9X6I2_9AGAR|nr:hypothetical protein K443DRAFT_12987 [Laccaria amethystina LaAM-08-1]
MSSEYHVWASYTGHDDSCQLSVVIIYWSLKLYSQSVHATRLLDSTPSQSAS